MAGFAQSRGMVALKRKSIWVLLAAESTGSQIVEFAVSLPLLVVLVVGIFDFGSAFTVKQKLAYATRDGARVAASQPTNDLSLSGPPCSAPASVCALRDVVDQNLVAGKINDCGLASSNAASSGTLAWTFTASTSCPGTLTLTIDRGYTYTATLASPFQAAYTIEGTKVTLSYPYKWQFNKVIQFIAPGATYAGVSQIMSVGIMQNLN
jgi:TadE-like protein